MCILERTDNGEKVTRDFQPAVIQTVANYVFLNMCTEIKPTFCNGSLSLALAWMILFSLEKLSGMYSVADIQVVVHPGSF